MTEVLPKFRSLSGAARVVERVVGPEPGAVDPELLRRVVGAGIDAVAEEHRRELERHPLERLVLDPEQLGGVPHLR